MEKIGQILRTDTLRKSSITFSSTLINGILGIFFFILTARYLGPVSFGLMTVAIAANTLVTDISDIGVDSGLVRFVSKYVDSKPKKAFQFMKLALYIKLFVGFTIALIGFLLSPYIARFIFSKPELAVPLRIASIGVLGALLFDFSTHSLQSLKKFTSWGGLYISTNFIRLLIIFVLIFLNILDINSTMFVYILMPFIGFAFALFLLPVDFIKAKITSDVRKDFFHYNKWIALMTAVAATSSRMDVFISARFLSLDQVGIYSAANQLVQVVPQLAGAIGTVLAPKMAEKSDISDLLDYLKKSQLMVGGIAGIGFLSLPASFFLIPAVFGPNYMASVPVFVILFISMLIFLFSIPIHNAIFYYFAFPKLFFYLALSQLVVVAISSVLLISFFGTPGLAIAVLLGSLLNFIIPCYWLFRKIKNS